MIDFRSDTLTKPTPGMIEAMLNAVVGDDVYGEDPSIAALEQQMAAYFGMTEGLYCPSGTMSNQIAIKVHTQPGDEVICCDTAHVYIYEGGGIAFNAGCQVRPLSAERGLLEAATVREAINEDDVHKARTSLICLEQTSNRGGGSCYDMETLRQMAQLCAEQGVALHLDGARLFNALIATRHDPKDYGRIFSSISICFNKGMGCPMGSVLLGDGAFIKEARRIRKKMGGGLRQAGYMAATASYAFTHHLPLLEIDHEHAQQIAASLQQKSFIRKVHPVETNIILFEFVNNELQTRFIETLAKNGIKVSPIAKGQVRMVTHLGISRADIEHTQALIDQMQ
jgi:threonine aldolase